MVHHRFAVARFAAVLGARSAAVSLSVTLAASIAALVGSRAGEPHAVHIEAQTHLTAHHPADKCHFAHPGGVHRALLWLLCPTYRVGGGAGGAHAWAADEDEAVAHQAWD